MNSVLLSPNTHASLFIFCMIVKAKVYFSVVCTRGTAYSAHDTNFVIRILLYAQVALVYTYAIGIHTRISIQVIMESIRRSWSKSSQCFRKRCILVVLSVLIFVGMIVGGGIYV